MRFPFLLSSPFPPNPLSHPHPLPTPSIHPLPTYHSLTFHPSEYILHYLAIALRKTYDLINPIPKFVLMIFTGAAGSLIMGLLHRPSKEVKAKEERERVAAEKKAAQEKKEREEKEKKEVGVPGTPEKKGNGGGGEASTPGSAKKGKGKKGGKK